MSYQVIDFDVLNEIYLPTFLRSADVLAFMNSISNPLKELYAETLYKMQHTGQVIYLEKMLNEYYNIAGYDKNNHLATRQIYITDAPAVPRVYLYQPAENKPVYLYQPSEDNPVYLNLPAVQYDFIINVPAALVFDEQIMRIKVDYYRNTKQYIIQTYV